MYYNPLSRRYFLKGLGVGLMLPFMPSIMSKAYAAGFPIRYVQLMSPYGNPGDYFFPRNATLTPTASGIYASPLAAISGDIANQFGTSFNNFRNKMSLVRGLHVLPQSGFEEQHNASYPTCASAVNNGHDPNTNDNYPGFYPFSIDSVLAANDKIYPNANGIQRQVSICPAYRPGGRSNFSWARINNVVQKVALTTDTAALLAKFTKLTATGIPAPVAADATRKTNIIHNVYADYKAVRANPKLSTDDRNRLDSYISLVDEIQRGLASTPPPSSGVICQTPTLENDTDLDGRTRNQLRILAAAMACQLTRVASVTLVRPSDSDGTGHNLHHDASNADLAAYMKPNMEHVAFFMNLLNQITEGGGTMLDNTIVVASNEFGERYEGNVGGHIHTHKDMTVMVAGGGAGALQMGQYIDYRKTNGRPYNNFLISMYNAMGLSSVDYERDGIAGIGDYDQRLVDTFNFGAYVSTAEKRAPLPFLYNGPMRG
jgi:hypothetical protein